MSVRNILLATCAVIATTVTVHSQASDPAAAPPSVAEPRPVDAADALRAAGLGDLAPAAPAALELAKIPKEAAPAATPAIDPATAPIDLSALWYFATQKDFARVAAEIKLIRRTHPQWTPPQDLFSAADGGGPEEEPLWDLFKAGDFAGMHARIDAMKRERPDWTPSANLSGKLALAEARETLVKASDAKDWPGVVAVATANKMLLTCNDLDALWRTAEALGRSGDGARATEAYRYALTTCTTPHDRLATVQKAGLVLQSADLDKLLALGRRQADGSGEFDALRFDRLRSQIGAAIGDRTLPAPAQADLDALAAVARTPAGKGDAQLLGWYSYSRKDYPGAQGWFTQAMSAGPDPKAAEGLVLSLRGSHALPAAREAALRYAALGPDNRRLMLEIVTAAITDPTAGTVSDAELAAFGDAVNDARSEDGAQALLFRADQKKDKKGVAEWTAKAIQWKGEEIEANRSAEGAEALGWQLYTSNDLAGAQTWFGKSADWAPSESAAVGLVLTAHRLHHTGDYNARVAQYRAMFPRVAELEAQMRVQGPQPGKARVADRRLARTAQSGSGDRAAGSGNWDKSADDIIKTFHAGDYDKAVAMMDQRRARRSEPRGLSIVRAWALYHKGDWEGAKQAFSSLDAGELSRDREVGMRLIEQGYTNPRYR